MSDGPHRALPMRAPWKRAAERADNTAFDVAEITEAIATATVPDFHADVPPKLLAEVQNIANAEQKNLFASDSIAALEKIKREHAVEPRARDFVDRVIAAVKDGKSALAALASSIEQNIRQAVANSNRHIEEFYRRKTKASRSLNVRARLDQGASRLNFGEIVQRILAPKGQKNPRTSRKKGLDDGVPLP